ncbi:LytTR family transcriptional regulator DNA-binding domain-containing protein [Enterococcus sp. ALS3]|uniref:LytTR family transcriptional regulator DNA-binding domain-containing protein n=1 Tax=Enterococcus alishanensis TaxID=1303817 RepID=A0ABS6TGL5_9ENTE|nr:LytTR family transcriptional regulator DNA-binding domain-containing protein [Enterococcus alishanensis]MBV7392075.1 LytTR family transcriptional regulator DNA-binding domain-containing protein [Enterococcus alishanensis]
MSYTINVFVIEDELSHKKAVTNSLRDFAEKSPYLDFHFQDTFNYLTLYNDIEKINFSDNDIVMIDIHLNTSFTGVELAQKIRAKNAQLFILFLTSDQTLGPYSINQQTYPLAYLNKNVHSQVISNEELFPFLTEIQSTILKRVSNNDVIEIKTQQQLILMNPLDIFYVATLAGVQKKTVVKTKNDEFIANERLIDLKKRLTAPVFYFKMKSYIINLAAIVSINQNEGVLYFPEAQELYVGSKQLSKIRKALEKSQ